MTRLARKTEASPADRFPSINERLESNLEGLYVVGDLTGMPLLKNALNHGYDVVQQIAARVDAGKTATDYDVVIVGAGAAGISAAMAATEKGLRYVVLEKARAANTLHNFPARKKIYAEPVALETRGNLWLGQAEKEEFLARWRETIEQEQLEIRENTEVADIRKNGHFEVLTAEGQTLTSQFVILAIGKQGTPRRLNVPGEDLPKVFTRLYDPADFKGREILVVGGGDSAIESALALSESNHVTLSYRRSDFARPKPDNARLIREAIESDRIDVLFSSTVKEVRDGEVVLSVEGDEKTIANDLVFTMVGTQLPLDFFRKIGLRLENEWDKKRWAKLGLWSLLVFTLYYVKKFSPDHPFFCDCPLHAPSFGLVAVASDLWAKANASARVWYPALYSAVVCGFGLYVIFRRKPSRYTFWRTVFCMGFQTVLFFLLPWLLNEGNLYRLGYAWPLSMGAVFRPNPKYVHLLTADFWWLYGLLFAFVGIPLLTYFHGKRYCAWLCGCGCLAETGGDPFRKLAPKGERAEKWENMIYVVLGAAVVVTLLKAFHAGQEGAKLYDLFVMWALSGWVAIAAYPFFGGRIWCRYWCPLAAYMNLIGKVASRWQIGAVRGKCIDCGLCNMNCEMGIDIKKRAIRGQPVTLKDTPCVGCGECVRVCPMDCLYVGHRKDPEQRWQLPSNDEILGIQ